METVSVYVNSATSLKVHLWHVPRTREGPFGRRGRNAEGRTCMFAVGINISHGKRTGLSSLITIDHERSRERLEGRRYRHDSILPVSRVLRQQAGRGARAHLAHAYRCISVPSRDHVTRVATRIRTRVVSWRAHLDSLINRYNRHGSNTGRRGDARRLARYGKIFRQRRRRWRCCE